MLHRGRHTVHVLHRPLADVQVQVLAQGHVQGADAATDGGGQWAFDADYKFAEGSDGLFRQPFSEHMVGFFARVDFHPMHFAFASVSLFYGCIEHAHGSLPDIAAGAVALDEG